MRKGPSRLLYVPALALGSVAALAAPATGIAAARHQPPAKGLSAPAPYMVAIMPGHGGYDPGAISPFNHLKEKNVTLGMGLDLRRDLEAYDIKVVMTRTTDTDVSVAHAESLARQSHADVLVSLWVNDWTDTSLEGLTVFTPHPWDRGLAGHLDAGLANTLGPLGMGNRGTAALPQLWVHAPMPAVTIEIGFMSNPTDSQLLAQPSFRAAAASGITQGLLADAPQILRIRTQLVAYRRAQARLRAASLAAARRFTTIRQLQGWAPALLLLDLLLALVAYRRAWSRALVRRLPTGLRRVLRPGGALAAAAFRGGSGRRPPGPARGPGRPAPAGASWGRRPAAERHRPPRQWRGAAAAIHPRRVTEMVQPADRGRRSLYDDFSF
ncbi:MAG: N-acetylmuramoyl-L-alanine amidase family protein [Candidatus Dormibacteria bacterium]